MNCLIDNGSTTSLISVHQYNKIITNSRPSLQSISYSLLDVNGKPINVYGKAEFEFCFENGQKYNIPAIVCEVEVDGILGQDFLCGNIKTIDYENDELVTKCGKIRLYPGHGTNYNSRAFLSVKRSQYLGGEWKHQHMNLKLFSFILPLSVNSIVCANGVTSLRLKFRKRYNISK